jgi:hypothetical protein
MRSSGIDGKANRDRPPTSAIFNETMVDIGRQMKQSQVEEDRVSYPARAPMRSSGIDGKANRDRPPTSAILNETVVDIGRQMKQSQVEEAKL